MASPEPDEGFIIARGSNRLEIGSRIIAAPMAGVLESPFRMLLHDRGLDLSFTEMISARGTYEGSKKTMELAGWIPEKGFSGAQIFGSDPKYLTYAAKRMEEIGHAIIDLNSGCPKRKVLVQGSGGAMLKDSGNLIRCLSSIIDSVDAPVGIKMRSGYHHFDEVKFKILLRDIEGIGASYVAIHPRTVVQGFKGSADRNVITISSNTIGIPIIASGDVRTQDDVHDLFSRGAEAVMVGRALMGNPGVIERLKSGNIERDASSSPDKVDEILKTARDHLERNISYFGEKRGCIKFRPHLGWYVKGFKGKNSVRDSIYHVERRDEIIELLEHIRVLWIEEVCTVH